MGGGVRVTRVGTGAIAIALLAGLAAWLIGAGSAVSGAEQADWPLSQIRAPDAWPVSTGQGVTIGVVDSGIDPTAPAVAGRVAQTADCVGSGGDENLCRPGVAPDTVGHGTVVSSVAAQVAPGARFVVARAVAGKQGGDDDVSAAIDWVVDRGAQVVNVSIADEDSSDIPLSPRMTDAVERAWQRGAVPVLASGNTGGASGYGNADALVVAATTSSGSLAPYSAQTSTVKWGFAAPGSIVMVLANGARLLHQGTSVAAPNVTGAMALLLAHGESRATAIQRLASTAVPCAGCGHGRIDVAAALGVPAPVPSTEPPPVTEPPAPPAPPPVELTVPDPALLDQAPGLGDLAPNP